MQITRVVDGATVTSQVRRLERVPIEGRPEQQVVSKVTVRECDDLGDGGVARLVDEVSVESEGKPVGVLLVRRGLGERVARWLLPDARVQGVE
jgi:hypothetical protein